MSDNDLLRPHGICGECQSLRTPRIHNATGRQFVYCPHNMTGGVLERREDGKLMWHLFTPVTRESFQQQQDLYAARYTELNGAPPWPLN